MLLFKAQHERITSAITATKEIFIISLKFCLMEVFITKIFDAPKYKALIIEVKIPIKKI